MAWTLSRPNLYFGRPNRTKPRQISGPGANPMLLTLRDRSSYGLRAVIGEINTALAYPALALRASTSAYAHWSRVRTSVHHRRKTGKRQDKLTSWSLDIMSLESFQWEKTVVGPRPLVDLKFLIVFGCLRHLKTLVKDLPSSKHISVMVNFLWYHNWLWRIMLYCK